MQYLIDSLFEGGMLSGFLAVFFFFTIIALLKMMIRVELPNRLLVVTGRKRVRGEKSFGFSVEKGRTFVIPYIQQIGYMDTEVLPINVRVDGVNSANGITVGADATACVCIDGDDEGMVYSSVEKLMGKGRGQIREQIQQTLIGNFRGALNKATPLQAIGMEELDEEDRHLDIAKDQGERAQFRQALMEDINSDLSSFGMKVVSVSLQNIWDSSNYIANLAITTLSQKRQEVEIQESRLRAQAQQAESDAERRIAVARNEADEKIIAAKQKLEVFRRESEASIKQARLEAENSIAEAVNRGEGAVQKRSVELMELRNESNVVLEADARAQATKIRAEGVAEAVRIREGARNEILQQKVSLLSRSEIGKTILFIQQQLPALYAAYQNYAQKQSVDSLVIMDDKKGFSGAVNRGPEAFANFLNLFEQTYGISIKEILGTHLEEPAAQGGVR